MATPFSKIPCFVWLLTVPYFLLHQGLYFGKNIRCVHIGVNFQRTTIFHPTQLHHAHLSLQTGLLKTGLIDEPKIEKLDLDTSKLFILHNPPPH